MIRFLIASVLAVALCSPADAQIRRFKRLGAQRPLVRVLSQVKARITLCPPRCRMQTRQPSQPYVGQPSQPYTGQPSQPYTGQPSDPFVDQPDAQPDFGPGEGSSPPPVLPEVMPDDLGPQEDEKNPFQASAPADVLVCTPSGSEVFLTPLETEVDVTELHTLELGTKGELDQVVEATVRVTVNGVCGSGTIVGKEGTSAIILTNAHVAGTRRGRVVNVQRWALDGSSEKGTAEIIAAGYGQGVSIDFALLKCRGDFATDVMPIPLANRYPSQKDGIVTNGCPRCEWPSMQALRMIKADSQILRWYPAAIGGRSGSSLVDLTEAGPRVVGLLTWGNGTEGLGQSAPFLLEAIKGRLPANFEPLPQGVVELSYPQKEVEPGIWTMPATLLGTQDAGLYDSILAPEFKQAPPEAEIDGEGNLVLQEGSTGPILTILKSVKQFMITLCIAVAAFIFGAVFGRPVLKLLGWVV